MRQRRQSCAARFSPSSRWSGTPTVFRRRGEADEERLELVEDGTWCKWNIEGARQTARLLAVIWLHADRAETW
jgi:hypothetical protein